MKEYSIGGNTGKSHYGNVFLIYECMNAIIMTLLQNKMSPQ